MRQYIGARYVIKIYENSQDISTSEWESGVNYEPLTLVTYNYGSYLSKKAVPASIGDPASNPVYWAQTGFYSGQIASILARLDDIELLTNDFVTPEQFGAAGDGTTDDYAAIMDALAANKPVIFANKTYAVSATIIIDNPCRLIGSKGGEYGTNTVIKMLSDNVDCIHIDAKGCLFSDMTILGTGSGTGNGIIIGESDLAFQTKMEAVTVRNFGGSGVILKSCNNGVFNNVQTLYNGGDGFHIDYQGTDINGNIFNITNSYGNGGDGVFMSGEGSHLYTVSQSNNGNNLTVRGWCNGCTITGYTEHSTTGYEIELVGNTFNNVIAMTARTLTNKQFKDNGFYNDVLLTEDFLTPPEIQYYLMKKVNLVSDNGTLKDLQSGLTVFNSFASFSDPVPFTNNYLGLVLTARTSIGKMEFALDGDGGVWYRSSSNGAYTQLYGEKNYASSDMTPASNITLDSAWTRLTMNGKHGSLSVRMTAGANFSAYTNLLTLPISVSATFATAGGKMFRINGNSILCESAISSGDVIEFNVPIST